MNAGMRQRVFGAGLVLGALAPALRPVLATAQQGAIEGRVTDQATGQALEAARVMMTNSNRIETTNREGHYRFRDVADGSYQIRVLRVGFKPVTDTANVAPGETVALDFAMEPAPVQLDEIVSTATGEQRKLEVANAVSTIDAAKVAEEAPITEFGNLLSGRAAGRAGAQKSGGTTGTGTRIRIRGSNSISLSNEPLYYIDGIRMESNASSQSLDIGGFGVGPGAAPVPDQRPQPRRHRVDRDREGSGRRHPVRHPGLQRGGPDHHQARGRAGKPRWNLFTEVGGVHDYNTYPLNFFGRDTTAATGPDWDYFCYRAIPWLGTAPRPPCCKYSPLQDPAHARSRPACASSTGPTCPVATTWSPTYCRRRIRERGRRLPPAAGRGGLGPATLLGTVPGQSDPAQHAGAGEPARQSGGQRLRQLRPPGLVGYISSDTRFVENDNSVLTITGSAETSTNPPDVMRGWYYTPAQLFAELANQGIERFTGGLTYNWRPTPGSAPGRPWGTTSSTARTSSSSRPGKSPHQDQNNDGIRTDNRFQISQTSVDLAATARFKLSPTIGSKTSVGGQFFRDFSYRYPGDRARPRAGIRDDHRRGHDRGEATRPSSRRSLGSLHRGGDRAQRAPVPDRRRAVRRQQCLRQELRRDHLPQGQRIVAPVRRAVLQLRVFLNTLRLRGALGVFGTATGYRSTRCGTTRRSQARRTRPRASAR